MKPSGTRLGALTLSPDEFPHIHELGAHLGKVNHDAEFEFGLDLLLTGLKKYKERR